MVSQMSTAPLDGTRVLVWERLHGFCHRYHRYVPTGERWVEAFFSDGRWQEWCGKGITSTATIDPIGWIQLPPKGFEVRA